MERVKRFELSTSSLARKRSSQLSYTRGQGKESTPTGWKSQLSEEVLNIDMISVNRG
jgi:hypothetical protein